MSVDIRLLLMVYGIRVDAQCVLQMFQVERRVYGSIEDRPMPRMRVIALDI